MECSERTPWQGGTLCAEVLAAVLQWLTGDELRVAAAVCREWRSAALEPSLWRRTLLPNAKPEQLRALRRAITVAHLHTESSWCWWSWRREYLLSAARWRLLEKRQAASGAQITHAALSHCGHRLAVAADNATLTMWERDDADSVSWRRCWRRSERARGWAAAGAVRWAPADERLLLAGPLALADRWEILILRFNEDGEATAEVRSESGSCGGCWLDDAVFATTSVRLLAPGRAITTLWLNAAEQKVQSEYAGVTTPVLRIYNESAAHISHLEVAYVADEDLSNHEQSRISHCTREDSSLFTNERGPDASYWHATLPVHLERWRRVVIAALGAAGEERGVAKALCTWQLPLTAPPPVFATTTLAERVRVREQRRFQQRLPDDEPPPPSEQELRALCTPPLATYRMRGRVRGLQVHHNGGCVWASTRSGVECASLPSLRPLMRVSMVDPAPSALTLPYLVQPAVSDDFIVTPAGDGSGRVCFWCARSGTKGAVLTHPAPATTTLLASHPHHLLVFAGDSFYRCSGPPTVWRRSTSKLPPRTSCAGEELPPCKECIPQPAPLCRAERRSTLSGVRVACHPPPTGKRPPCPHPPPPCAISCQQVPTQINETSLQENKHGTTMPCTPLKKRCGDTLDRVALRFAEAKLARRLEYEREVAVERKNTENTPSPLNTNYFLGSDREVARATDGRDYVVLGSRHDIAGSSKNQHTVQLESSKDCTIKHSAQELDPCSHHPRVLLNIDRNDDNSTLSSEKSPITVNKHAIKRKPCKANTTGNLNEWCLSPPELAPDPSRCCQPSLVERLKRKSKRLPIVSQKLHTFPVYFQSQYNECNKTLSTTDFDKIMSAVNKDKEKFNKMIVERNKLNETGRGRTTCEQKEEPTSNGYVELKTPPGTHSVRVYVGLFSSPYCEADASSPRPLKPTSPGNSNDALAVFSEKENSWLSLKNIQKKLTNCRKETKQIAVTSSTGDGCTKSQTTFKDNNDMKENICKNKKKPEPSPSEPKATNPSNPCAIKQKPNQPPCTTKPSPCNAKPSSGTERWSSSFEKVTNLILSV